MFPAKVQFLISNYLIFGLIPLDRTLHFVVGMIISIIMREKKQSFKKIFIVIGVLELIKEVIDIRTLNHKFTDTIWDAAVTFAYPLILIGTMQLKEWLKGKEA